MTVIDDVIAWANTLPAWQGDAVRRILIAGDGPFSEQDIAEILALAKTALNLAQPVAELRPIPPNGAVLREAAATVNSMRLVSISNVQDVNIIETGNALPFSEDGLTIVYGDNGSGKSGYARILKAACQARDKGEPILPSVFATEKTGVPRATITIKQGDQVRDIAWSRDTTPDQRLSRITVFDGRCARVITDEKNTLTYLPYGADTFRRLAEVVQLVKGKLEDEMTSPAKIQDSAILPATMAEVFVRSLSALTKDEDIEANTEWNQRDDDELTKLEELVRVSNPTVATEELARLEQTSVRIREVASAAAEMAVTCSELSDETLQKAVAELDAARLARDTAAAERQRPELLPGTAATSQWEILYRAAKKYSEEVAYPGEMFPKTDGAVCVLCQQPLNGEAAARLVRFRQFMEDTTNSVLKAKQAQLETIREQAERLAPLSGLGLDSICQEVAALDASTGVALRTYHEGIAARKAMIMELLNGPGTGNGRLSLPAWPPECHSPVQRVVKTLSEKAEAIRGATDPDEYKKLTTRIDELKSRRALNARKAEIVAYVIMQRHNAALRSACDSLRTNEITREGRTTIARHLTPEFARAIEEELAALGAARVRVSVRPSGAVGETTHEMLLDGANLGGRLTLSQVLSEGEARVVAVAGFLAELKLAANNDPIVLDDPVSSLDHVFTRKIAVRLVAEAARRQVILFTHDIAFFMELKDAADALAEAGSPVGIQVRVVRRGGASAGITTDGTPWHGSRVTERVHYLEQQARAIRQLYENRSPEYNEKASRIYGLLREAWEACIEDDLLYAVVCRYRNSVETRRLMQVEIDDNDVHEINRNMSKASTWMTGHDKARTLHDDRPAPEELLRDIDELRQFSKKVSGRRNATDKRRKDQLKP